MSRETNANEGLATQEPHGLKPILRSTFYVLVQFLRKMEVGGFYEDT
jgi:hypothetical protein